jgi:DNA-binding protein Fis
MMEMTAERNAENRTAMGSQNRQRPDTFGRLLELARFLSNEVNQLVLSERFRELSQYAATVDESGGLSFYDEVERFEIRLIKLMLKMTGGSQVRAARLLDLKPTTLNAKIKQYGIR